MEGDSWIARLRKYDVLLLVSGIWFLGQFTRYVFPPLFETFRGAYGVSNTTLGLLFSLLMVAYAGMQFPSGALADRLGTVRVIAGGATVLGGAALVLAVSDAFPVLVAVIVLIGIGSGAHKTVAITLLSSVYPGRTGRTLGTMDAIGQLGGVATPAIVVAVLAAAVAWNAVFLVVGLAGIALTAAFYRRAGRRATTATDPAGETSELPAPRACLRAFAAPRFVVFVTISIAFTFAWNGLAAFLPLYLTSAKGLAQGTAGLLYSGLFMASLVQPATGALSDRFGRLQVVVGTLGLATICLLVVLGTTGVAAVGVAVILLGVGVHGFRPVRDAYLVAVIPESVGGGTLGIVRTLMALVGSVAPAIVGYLSDVATFDAAFGLVTGVLGAGTAGALGLLRPQVGDVFAVGRD